MSLATDSRCWVAPRLESVPVYFLPTMNLLDIPRRLVPNNLRMMKALKKIGPDLVHLHVQHYLSPAIVLSGLPYVLTSWGVEVMKLPETDLLQRTSARFTAAKALRITVDAKCLKDIWIRVGIPEDKIEIIPFGVDTRIFNPSVEGRLLRKKLQIGEADIVIISTRPFYNDHYNLECLIRAIPLILKKCNHLKVIVKGAGPLEAYLRSLVSKLNIREHVRFAGVVPYHEVPRYLCAADIYVSTCFVDSTSVSLLEAMACGLAPLVTDIPGNREWIEDGVNGFLFPPRSSTILAEKAIQLIQNPQLRGRFGERCIQKIEERAAWEKCVSKMEAIYRSLS